MQKEKEFFIRVLADHLNNKRKTTVSDNLNWNELEKIGRDQQLSGIVYHQCSSDISKSDLPTEVKTNWRLRYAINSFMYSKRLALLGQIDKEFQKENIVYIIVKGTEVAKFFPVPAQRTMSDLDLLVHVEDKQRACDTLVRMGFEMKTCSSDEWCGFKNEMVIELHHRLIYAHSVELEALQAWGDKVWDYAFVKKDSMQRKLDLTYHMVYLLLHLRKHLLEQGVGFRQFMDVAVLVSQPGINWQQAETWFKELNLEKFSQVCFAFCKRWFNIQVPFCRSELEDEFYNNYTEKVFAGGVFGTNDKEHKENAIFNKLHYAKSSSSSISIFLRHAFLPYEEMRALPYCYFLNERPYLLPIAWCWRIIYKVGTGSLVPLIKGAYGNETIKKKEEMLSKWGL